LWNHSRCPSRIGDVPAVQDNGTKALNSMIMIMFFNQISDLQTAVSMQLPLPGQGREKDTAKFAWKVSTISVPIKWSTMTFPVSSKILEPRD